METRERVAKNKGETLRHLFEGGENLLSTKAAATGTNRLAGADCLPERRLIFAWSRDSQTLVKSSQVILVQVQLKRIA